MTRFWKPALMGSAMGLMLLWMLHGVLAGDANYSGLALLAFLGAHFAIAAALLGAALAWPRLKDSLHRPSRHHVMPMLGSAMLTVGLAHIVIHGGL